MVEESKTRREIAEEGLAYLAGHGVKESTKMPGDLELNENGLGYLLTCVKQSVGMHKALKSGVADRVIPGHPLIGKNPGLSVIDAVLESERDDSRREELSAIRKYWEVNYNSIASDVHRYKPK